jgi:LysM repeat protein
MEVLQTNSVLPGNIQADIQGEVSGQIAVGNYNLQIGSVHGGVVNINVPRPRLTARPTPVYILPRRFAGLLDRVDEVEQAAGSLTETEPVELTGKAGAGKTSLLRHLARHSLVGTFPDGVIYLLASDKPAGELLWCIFDAMYAYDAPTKPGESEMRHALQNKKLLILLDDVELEREALEGLMDAVPESTFLLTSTARQLWGGGQSIAVPGLPFVEARMLFERELGVSVTAEEIETLDELCRVLHGHPLHIVQAACLVHDGVRTLAELLQALRTCEPDEILSDLAMASTDEDERKVMAALAVLGKLPLHQRHLPVLTGVEDPAPTLKKMQKRGLLQSHGSWWCLAGGLPGWVKKNWGLAQWRQTLVDYFSSWAKSLPGVHAVAEEASTIVHLVEAAVGEGAWQPALNLARSTEGSLALGMRWEAWGRVLDAGLKAAQASSDLHTRGLMLHQIGTRALCLGEHATARRYLVRALRLRQSIGDQAGAALTWHNLRFLLGPDNPDENNPSQPPGSPGRQNPIPKWILPAVKGGIAGVVVSAFLIAAIATGLAAIRPETATPAPTVAAVYRSTPTGNSQVDAGQPNTPATDFPVPAATITPAPLSSVTPEAAASVTPQPAQPTATPDRDISGAPDNAGEAPANTDTAPVTQPVCKPRSNWPVYTIRRGDTLWSIAQATGASVQELMRANCLNSSIIITAQKLFVPRLPPEPATAVPSLPDLLVSSFVLGEPSSGEKAQTVVLPFRMTIANRGQRSAEAFDVIVFYRLADGALETQSIQVTDGIPAGETRELPGRLTFHQPLQPTRLTAWAKADACEAGDACRVRESNEKNNTTPETEARLPGNQAPRVEMLEPGEGAVFGYADNSDAGWFAVVTAAGRAGDPEDGELGGESLVWSTDRTDLQDGFLGTGSQLRLRLFSDSCEGVVHHITLTAVDAQGVQSSVTRAVRLQRDDCRPTLSIRAPQSGVWDYSGYDDSAQRYYLALDGVVEAYDVYGQPIRGKDIVWTTDRGDLQDPGLGSGSSIGLRLYMDEPGAGCLQTVHTLTVTVTDRDGRQASDSVRITISGPCLEG